MTELFGIYWSALNRLAWLPLFFVIIIALIKNYKKTLWAIQLLVHPTHQKNLFPQVTPWRQFLKMIAYLCTLFFLFIALLQPQWHKKEETLAQEGRDLVIALDISRSMLAQDSKPSRLESVKLKIKALLNKLSFERVGLILFSGSAFIQCPLTVDYATFLLFLDQVDVETIASGTTAIDTALNKAIELYKNYPGRKNKLLLLITDGEDFSFNLRSVQEQTKKEGIKAFALGVGTPQGAPIPKTDFSGHQTGHETDEQGNVALSRLNEPFLQELATNLDGQYLRMTYDDSDLDYLVYSIEKFEKETFDDKKFSLYEDQYPWFLGIAWFLLALEWIL